MTDETKTVAPRTELVSIHDVAVVTTIETRDVLESFATQLETERVPAWLARTTELIEWLGVFKKYLEGRVLTDPDVQKILTGTWADPDTDKRWEWSGRHAKGWTDIPAMIETLFAAGMPTRAILESISELRVTDLRDSANTIKDEARRTEILDIIEDHRGEGDGPKHLRVAR